ncbi:hypothetical protein BU15DRAFT_51250, partial [Melanogaster broomeanus]
MTSNGGNGPPGLSSYHVQLGDDTEQLRAWAESTETQDQLMIHSIEIEINEPNLDNYDSLIYAPRGCMGDPLARRAEEILRRCTPYPKDDPRDDRVYDQHRFTVYRISDDAHIISDDRRRDLSVQVPTRLLWNREFCIADFYTSQLARLCRMTKDEKRQFYRRLPMGEAICRRIVDALDRGVIPEERLHNLPFRFACTAIGKAGSPERYEIRDRALHFHVVVPAELAIRSAFNVVRWYEAQVRKAYAELADIASAEDREVDVLRVLYHEPLSDHEAALANLAAELCTPLP